MLPKKKTPVPKTPEERQIEAGELAEKWASEGVEVEAIYARLEKAELGGLIERLEIFQIVKNARMVGSIHNDQSWHHVAEIAGFAAVVVGIGMLAAPIVTGLGLPNSKLVVRCIFLIVIGIFIYRYPESIESDS